MNKIRNIKNRKKQMLRVKNKNRRSRRSNLREEPEKGKTENNKAGRDMAMDILTVKAVVLKNQDVKTKGTMLQKSHNRDRLNGEAISSKASHKQLLIAHQEENNRKLHKKNNLPVMLSKSNITTIKDIINQESKMPDKNRDIAIIRVTDMDMDMVTDRLKFINMATPTDMDTVIATATTKLMIMVILMKPNMDTGILTDTDTATVITRVTNTVKDILMVITTGINTAIIKDPRVDTDTEVTVRDMLKKKNYDHSLIILQNPLKLHNTYYKYPKPIST